jgi:hypothetical protein
MAPRRKPPQKAGQLNFADELAQSVAKPEPKESAERERTPMVGDIVTVGTGKSELRVTKVYYDRSAVDLELPGTNLERFRVRVEDLNFVERQPRKPKEPEKPKIDVEEIREHIDAVHHSIMEHINGEIAVLKKYLKSKGVSQSASGSLDDFCKATEAGWKDTVKSIGETLDD